MPMTLKMTFLGTGAAFSVGTGNFHSNVLLELGDESLLVDAGSDVRHSLFEQHRTYLDIDNVYISHLHADHCGGLEWLALTTYFDSRHKKKPNLFVSENIVHGLWNNALSAGLSTLSNMSASLETYFNVNLVEQNGFFVWQTITFSLVQMIHFFSNHQLMPSYGLMFTYNNTRIFYTSDTQFTLDHLMPFYEEADIIFHDCEILPQKSGVHAHYVDLVSLPARLKKKMWLYHYGTGSLPDSKKDGFSGFVTKGQVFTF